MSDEDEPSKAVAVITQALEWAYGHAAESAADLAESHLKSCGDDREKAIDDLIAWYVAYAGAVGFVSNVGGVITMPVTIPANLGGVLYIQLRLIAAIAYLRGYPIKDEKVKTLAFICLTGSSAATLLQEFGISLGTKLSARLIAQISGATLININKAVGFRLIAKTGSTALITLSKVVPFVGALVGGAFDAAVTGGIGAAAKEVFKPIDDA
jgi:hypothetical protein